MTDLEVDGETVTLTPLSTRQVDELFDLYIGSQNAEDDSEGAKKLMEFRDEVIRILPDVSDRDEEWWEGIPASERRKAMEYVAEEEVFAELDFMKPPEM